MGVHFAAVHERDTWRKHSKHSTLQAATTGEDGAENLLRNIGRVGAKRALYGVVYAVFVWDDHMQEADALRLVPGSSYEIERKRIPVGLLEDFTRKRGPSLAQIDEWFEASSSLVGKAPEGASRGHPPRQFRYGEKPTWEIVFDAVREFGRPVSTAEVGDRIASEIPGFARANLGPDLSVLSVNCFSRGNHAVNRIPRRTDTGNAYDRLIRIGSGPGVLFTVYDPSVHGTWALVEVGEKVLRPKFLSDADRAELESARDAATATGVFDPSVDARRRIMSAIVQREGQPAFRRALLDAYGGACAISGCTVEALLEAAHIFPYLGSHTNVVENGLLLRADLHKMFDLHLFRIDPRTRTVHLSDELQSSEYACFDGVSLRRPVEPSMVPRSDALTYHEERCGWMNAGPEGRPLDNLPVGP